MGDFIFERWRKPPNILHIETDTTGATFRFDGDEREFNDVRVNADQDTIQRYREGRLCFNCIFEPFPEPFPERCPVCGYEVRDRQAVEVAAKYVGVEDMRAMQSIEAEEARMQEQNERRRHNPHSRIWLPTKET